MQKDFKKDRQLVAKLIYDVLLNKISVVNALTIFPKNVEDINIKCAFDALVHRESDEELRLNTPNFAQVQDEYLQEIADILNKNQELPRNIIDEYLKYHADNLISDFDNSFLNILKKIRKMINF